MTYMYIGRSADIGDIRVEIKGRYRWVGLTASDVQISISHGKGTSLIQHLKHPAVVNCSSIATGNHSTSRLLIPKYAYVRSGTSTYLSAHRQQATGYRYGGVARCRIFNRIITTTHI